ncbi:hypothetical protein AB1Y20_020950 [Prymnesium parvum]|uniref:Uncharacterized protein n=1 Tax=Prymnesium parvum TaxID=97485 RepID=A0AB34JKM7_PRYPA|mmetsp:Transcript_15406/g.36995  ORF Transcript_15406/g.36995 Transcript_15406/m.36995 type:complete len:342 (-) Transcript_15406:300-1325(-)|eukprot:CAMPEP_0205871844 /NCGR_PEP_ID=MMETSP1083-20121108/11313_1 /ASSEMBLY_ACC=CAM_ASM_000430 /TAXON_ID=97485 /ORGANISM="Prymnesium parvum, Strain Texoma1" /LENGTH=341 /DNA_ID=CAMNT_0053234229 /DNA_START=28 /DNA_END=1053 /DNA_ORIENTATION=-
MAAEAELPLESTIEAAAQRLQLTDEGAGPSSEPEDGGMPAEDAFRRWLTPYQRTILTHELGKRSYSPPQVEALLLQLLEETLETHEDGWVVLEGLNHRPDLNGSAAKMLGPKEEGGRYLVRVGLDSGRPENIRVRAVHMMPPDPEQVQRRAKMRQRANKGKARAKASRAEPGALSSGEGVVSTEVSVDLDRRRELLLDKVQQMNLQATDLARHREHLNTLAERLQGTRTQLQKRYQITEGLIKQTRDSVKIFKLMQQRETIRHQEKIFNFNVGRIHAEERWLSEQPAFQEAVNALHEQFTKTKTGVISNEDLARDQSLTFEDLLREMKAEDQADQQRQRSN